jgi:TrmH family RNA methyltransferase
VLITSSQNALVKRIRSLRTRKGRNLTGAFWVEGIQPCLEALDAGWPLERIVWARDLLTSPRALAAVSDRPESVEVTADVFRGLSGRDGPQGLGVVGRIRTAVLDEVDTGRGPLIAVERAQDVGNVGSIVRTALCTGASGVAFLGPSGDPFDPHALRASVGSLFRLPVVVGASAADFLAWAARGGVRLLGTSSRGEKDYREVAVTPPCALVFGSEQKGLSTELREGVDVLLRIPTVGGRSLNLSAAVAVVACAAVPRT